MSAFRVFNNRRSVRRVLLTLLSLVGGSAVVAGRAHAQDVPNRESALEVRTFFLADLDTLQSKIMALAEAIPADKYSWRPAPGVRSVGEAFLHVASEYYVFTPLSYGAAASPVVTRSEAGMKAFEAAATKADALKHLKEGFAYTRASLAALDPAKITGKQKLFGAQRSIVETSFIMSGDLHEHLGQLIAYARMVGVKPPWSK